MSALAACGGLTEWLRSLIGNQVRRNSPVGSSPMSSAIKSLGISTVSGLFIFVFDKNCHKIAIELWIEIRQKYYGILLI